MRHIINPQQPMLFDDSELYFGKKKIGMLSKTWAALFRREFLQLMPAEEVGKNFHPTLGCPTKELYSVLGLILLKDMMDLTVSGAVEKYNFCIQFQYALKLNPQTDSISEATYYRYQELIMQKDLAADIFFSVTGRIVSSLGLDTKRQRLDSTHIYSNMAALGRTRLMGVAIKRFLVSLKRHAATYYNALDETIRSRYAPSQSRLFAQERKKDAGQLCSSVAEDLLMLVERFGQNTEVAARNTYKAMVRILEEQCDIQAGKPVLKKKTGGGVMQNPSDEDATYDGHKGRGYQAQISESCSAQNEEQVITGCFAETACAQDEDALEPMLEQLQKNGFTPEEMLADGAYGSDANVQEAASRGVELQSPVKGKSGAENEYDLNIDDFDVDEQTEQVRCCPAGHSPVSSVRNPQTGEVRTVMEARECLNCSFSSECPVKNIKGTFVLRHTAKSRRIAARRREQDTNAFRENYRLRSGGESVNSGLKRKTGFGQLRRRGMGAVRMSVFLKAAGWNIFRAFSIMRKRKIAFWRPVLGRIKDSVIFFVSNCRFISNDMPQKRLIKENAA